MGLHIRRSNSKRWVAIGALVSIILVLGYADWYFNRPLKQTVQTQNPKAETKLPFSNIEGRYLFSGTTVWARAVEKYAHGNYAQPFSQLNTFNREAYDAWATDFECPITNNVVPYQTQIDNLVFNCRPEFLPEASKYFNLFDLANNHTDNQGGQEGIASTRKYLESAGVQYFGNYDPGLTKDTCEVIALPVRLQKLGKTEKKANLPIVFCAWHYFNRPDVRSGELEAMDEYAKVMPVFAFAEMGPEYYATALPAQVDIAHRIIDRGPEFLIANNPHWVQNTEVYKGKLIVYSTGNFIFDQIDMETQRGVSIDTTMTTTYDDNVAKWVALAPKCAVFHDDCLELAKQQGLKKIKIRLQYGVVANTSGYLKITQKAGAATQKAIEERLNWTKTLKELTQNE